MNPKLQKVTREIERARAKITELQALLPELERQKTEIENTEIIKAFRSADVAPADFSAFIEAYKMNGGARFSTPSAPKLTTPEDKCNEDEV